MTSSSHSGEDGSKHIRETVRIGVIGDTHALSFGQVPPEIREALQQTDWVIHVGDYTNKDVLDGFKKLKEGRFRGVQGNTDTSQVRQELPKREILQINGKRIGITHPEEAGPDEGLEEMVMAGFKDDKVDVIVYGHSHDAKFEERDGLLLFNPGKAYKQSSTFEPPASYGILTIGEEIRGEIVFI